MKNNTMEQYLDLIDTELQNNYPNNFSKTISLITVRKNNYNRFKREILRSIKNSNEISDNIKLFAFLMGSRFEDNEFVDVLISKFLNFYNNSKSAFAQFAKGIYAHRSNQKKVAVNLLWNVYKINQNYFTHYDFVNLIEILSEYNYLAELKELLTNLIARFPTIFEYHLHYLSCLRKVQELSGIDNPQIENIFNFVFENATTIYDWITVADEAFLLGKEKEFFIATEKAFLNLDFCPDIYGIDNKDKVFSAQKCLESVNEMLDILEKNGYQVALSGGTLLGLYRDGKLMDYDKDADLMLVVEKGNIDFIFNLINCVMIDERHNFSLAFDYHNLEILKKKPFIVTFKDEKRHIAIDIFFIYQNYFDLQPNDPRSNYFYAGLNPTKLGGLFWEYKFPFEVVKTKLAGRNYYLLNHPEKYLQEQYGNDWKKPVATWDSLISCPNLIPESKMMVYQRAILKFHRALNQRNYEKSKFYFMQLQRWNYPFSDAMKDSINKFLNSINKTK